MVAWWLYPLDSFDEAMLVAATMTLGNSIPHFLLTCRRLEVSAFTHIRKVYYKPLIPNAIFCLILIYTKSQIDAESYILGAVSGTSGARSRTNSHVLFFRSG